MNMDGTLTSTEKQGILNRISPCPTCKKGGQEHTVHRKWIGSGPGFGDNAEAMVTCACGRNRFVPVPVICA